MARSVLLVGVVAMFQVVVLLLSEYLHFTVKFQLFILQVDTIIVEPAVIAQSVE
jgi:hypothetical protein